MRILQKLCKTFLFCSMLMQMVSAAQPNPYKGGVQGQQLPSPTFKLSAQDEQAVVVPSNIGVVGIKYLHRPGSMSTIIDVYPETPADKAGVRVGDNLLEVDGTNVLALNADQVFGLMAGRPGEPVELKLMRCKNNYGSYQGCTPYYVTLKRMDMNYLSSDRVFNIYRYGN